MKTKQLFFCSLTGLALLTTSCSSNDEALNGGNGASSEGNAYAQIAISVANSATTRAVAGNTGEYEYGEDAEYTVNDLTVVLANENDIAMQVITPELKTATNEGEPDKLVRVTKPFKCTPGKYKVYVLANYKNSQSSLSPIIKGSTDMKAVFGITDNTTLWKENNFFMTNTSAPTEQTIDKNATKTEVDDAGKEMTDGKTNLNLLTVNVERAVSKVTFNQATPSFEIKEGGNTIATAELVGASLINLNKKMYLVKDGQAATNKPVTGEWPYPKDPNYDQTSIDKDYCDANFYQTSASVFSPLVPTSKFYCPENTMTALAQLNGQTTGVVYKVKYAPKDAYYTELDAENGTDSYSKMFKEVLNLTGKDPAIKNTIFTEAKNTDGTDITDGTFYSYNGYVFRSLAGARLYKAIATNTDGEATTVNAAFKTNGNDDDIQTYKEGYCYYTAWIKHNPTSKIYLEQDKYGVVRNFWYELTVNSIKKLGYSKPTYKDPTDPDDKAEASIQVQVNIKKWRWVKQTVDLE